MLDESYRDILKQEFEQRKNTNKSYSLRSFSRDLEVSASHLSEVLRGLGSIGRSSGEKIGYKLGLNFKEVEYFVALIDYEHSKNPRMKAKAREIIVNFQKSGFQKLADDEIALTNEWYFFGILSAMELDHYNGNLEFIQFELALDIETLKTAMDTLVRLGLVLMEDDKYCLTGAQFCFGGEQPSSYVRKHHRQHLELAADLLNRVPYSDRDYSGTTMAIDKSKIPKAREMIKKFRRELCRELESGAKNSVYQINIQLLPLFSKGLK